MSVTQYEWGIKLPNPIYQQKYPNHQNYLIFVTQLTMGGLQVSHWVFAVFLHPQHILHSEC